MEVLESGLPVDIGDEEDLARFLTSKSHFNSTMVKPVAFLPSSEDGMTSVYRHGREPVDDLWRIAAEHLPAVRFVYGACIVKGRTVRAAELQVAAQEPPPRHANIGGWAFVTSDPELTKARQMEQAARLVQFTERVLR